MTKLREKQTQKFQRKETKYPQLLFDNFLLAALIERYTTKLTNESMIYLIFLGFLLSLLYFVSLYFTGLYFDLHYLKQCIAIEQ